MQRHTHDGTHLIATKKHIILFIKSLCSINIQLHFVEPWLLYAELAL